MWQYHDKKMKELKQIYNKISKQTQNNLQSIFDSFNINFDNLYNIADKKNKKRINIQIEEWKEKGLLTGYFKMLANNIYNKSRVKNSEILELLIYGAYIEEQNKLDKYEKQIMYEDANYYYQQGQEEVNKTLNKKKPISILDMALFLALLDEANYSGLNWKQYIETTIMYNANQLYKQAIINIQQQKELKIDSDDFTKIINQQNNQKLNIKEGKISGSMDLTMIGLNNKAKVEGIKKNDNNAKVKFIAITDENSTEMCQSMNNMEFYIDKENEFDRYWGETKKELTLMRIKIKGLVLGINLPPISHHFHYCRSYIIYMPVIETFEESRYNESIPNEKTKKHNQKKNLSLEDIKKIANKMNNIVNKYTNNKSKWSGNVIISVDDTNAKLWNCDIEISSALEKYEIEHVLLHEHLHAHSISYYDKNIYNQYGRIEEATVELYTKEIEKLEHIKNVPSAYDEMVNSLLKINNKLKIEESNFNFSKALFNIPVTDRLNFLEDKISNYIKDKSIDEAIELNKLMEVLYVK